MHTPTQILLFTGMFLVLRDNKCPGKEKRHGAALTPDQDRAASKSDPSVAP